MDDECNVRHEKTMHMVFKANDMKKILKSSNEYTFQEIIIQ